MSVKKVLLSAWGLLTVGLVVVGIAGVPEDLRTWRIWLGVIGDWFEQYWLVRAGVALGGLGCWTVVVRLWRGVHAEELGIVAERRVQALTEYLPNLEGLFSDVMVEGHGIATQELFVRNRAKMHEVAHWLDSHGIRCPDEKPSLRDTYEWECFLGTLIPRIKTGDISGLSTLWDEMRPIMDAIGHARALADT